ncbi:ABC transporter ATP-binding protein [Rhizobium rhizoryzae]|jgi:peptide/nickel transport system ATP-binding protein|uniref:Peptide/nickel transport system ATP-binding protein n=1 Tax=Rhizobium rhizoryzae TaxID=451876 RepID=A0A7W6LEB4_9HYPH|nr:ATP-binding cassette domain-containing protein [Rhizobium rhizoryzae]MBB4142831.1 peptide/nickel transport system ATP-binding protein [Rhizobium rhizoryzae]
MSTLMEVRDAAVHTTEAQLVQPFSFALEAGRPFTILGETGSGKSLLAQAVMGLLPEGLMASGQLSIEGETLDLGRPGSQKRLWGRKVSILPQEPWLALDPIMAAQAQVEEGYRFLRNEESDVARRSATRDLQQLGVAEARRKLPGQLSGGMAQRVAFAAARAGGARIVIADEPTKGLDVTRRDEVIDLLMREVRAGGCVLVITHDLALARQMGGDLAVMLEGRIVEQGEALEVLAHPAHDYTRRLIAADPENWQTLDVETSSAGAPILEAKSIGKTRGGKQLFSGVDLTIRPGEIIGVTGPSGSGKSSLGDILLGLLKPDAGQVQRATGISIHRYQKLYQDPPAAFPARATLKQSLADLVALHRLEEVRIAPLMQRLRLAEHLLDRRPDQVSGGELQRFALLRVLLLDPVFLFADEPTSRLDLITQQETVELLVELARERGCALLLVSHDTALIEKTCDRTISIG